MGPKAKLFARVIRNLAMTHFIMGALVAALVLSGPSVRRQGDSLQVALPMLAWGCAASKGGGREFALRFFAMLTVAHVSKSALGEAGINQRPSGGDHGFPSAHSSAAALGASALVHDCLQHNPGAWIVTLAAAAYVGMSRLAVEAHDIWQVLAGLLLGWLADRSLRRESRIRCRVVRGLSWSIRGVRHLAWVACSRLACRLSIMGARVSAPAFVVAMHLATEPAHTETELAFYGGMQAVRGRGFSDANGDQVVDWQGRSLSAPPYYGVRLTQWSVTGWGYGVEVNHAKAYADVPANYGYERLEFSDGLNLVTANLWRRWETAQSRFVPYAGIGLGIAVPHVDVTPSGGAHTFGYQLSGPVMQAVLGLRRDLSPQWSILTEVKVTWSRHDVEIDGTGRLGTDLFTGAINLGLSRRF